MQDKTVYNTIKLFNITGNTSEHSDWFPIQKSWSHGSVLNAFTIFPIGITNTLIASQMENFQDRNSIREVVRHNRTAL